MFVDENNYPLIIRPSASNLAAELDAEDTPPSAMVGSPSPFTPLRRPRSRSLPKELWSNVHKLEVELIPVEDTAAEHAHILPSASEVIDHEVTPQQQVTPHSSVDCLFSSCHSHY